MKKDELRAKKREAKRREHMRMQRFLDNEAELGSDNEENDEG